MNKKNTDKTPDELRDSILNASLEHVAFDGWSDKALKTVSEDLHIETGIIDLAFPGGVIDIIDLYAKTLDLEMLEIIKDKGFENQKIRQKITNLVKLRIELETPYKEATRRTVAFLALPKNHIRSMKILYRSVDLMWKAIGDPSTDFNFYTKRMTLSAVYSSTFLYWLGDESDEASDTWEFLDRRIENVMDFEKVKAKYREKKPDMQKIWRELGKKRYGS